MSLSSFAGLRLLLSCLLLHGSEQICPSVCLCISDTVSCSATGLARLPSNLPSFSVTLDLTHNHLSWLGPNSFNTMTRLENLWMAHNRIVSMSPGAFLNVSGLRLLDLSSNKLQVVEQHYFQGLWRLEELRLFNNKIALVEAGTLGGLSSLKKVYFSFNQITHFPFFSIQDHSHPFLAMLDLSSNRMTRLPWEEIKALPRLVQKGLYLHNNSMICDCPMYSVFWHWNLRAYEPIKDFVDEHICNINGDPRTSIQFFHQNRFFLNCTVETVVLQPAAVLLSVVVVVEGDTARLDCKTPLNGADLSFTWFSPSRGLITQNSTNDTPISVLANGTLEVRATTVNDSGLYLCTALDIKQGLNATREVNVTVVLPAAEPFSTGYTTLLGCTVTLFLILIYLYLTPCHCSLRNLSATSYKHCAFLSIFSSSSRDQPKVETFKHIAFMQQAIKEEGSECLG